MKISKAQFVTKKIIKSRRKMDRLPTVTEARAEVENLISKGKKGHRNEEDDVLVAELEGIAPLGQLSRLLSL